MVKKFQKSVDTVFVYRRFYIIILFFHYIFGNNSYKNFTNVLKFLHIIEMDEFQTHTNLEQLTIIDKNTELFSFQHFVSLVL